MKRLEVMMTGHFCCCHFYKKRPPRFLKPRGAEEVSVDLAKALLSDGRVIRYFHKKKLGEGVEKTFFATEDENIVIGFYKDQEGICDPDRVDRLTRIIEKYNPTLDPNMGAFWATHFCWPTAIVVEPRVGILTPKFPSQYYFSDAKGEKKSRWFLSQRLIKRLNREERGSWLNRILTCRQLSRAVGRMHAAGLAHSDLSGNNVLMDPSLGICMLIDIDSLIVRNITPCKVLGTRGYIAPEVLVTADLPLKHPEKNLPNIRTDLHALAVIIYEILLLRHPLDGKKIHSDDPETDVSLAFGEKALFIEHPDDASNRPDNLKISCQAAGPYLASLFRRAFIEGLHDPDERPTAYEWEQALTRTTDILHPCQGSDCWHQWLICHKGEPLQCPFCEWKPSEKIPIMHLFRKYKKGQYLSENHYLTIWDKKKLGPWHTHTNVPYPAVLSDAFKCKGTFTFQDGTWIFRNESSEKMTCSAWERINPGESAEISDNKIVLLSKSHKGRLAMFELL